MGWSEEVATEGAASAAPVVWLAAARLASILWLLRISFSVSKPTLTEHRLAARLFRQVAPIAATPRLMPLAPFVAGRALPRITGCSTARAALPGAQDQLRALRLSLNRLLCRRFQQRREPLKLLPTREPDGQRAQA